MSDLGRFMLVRVRLRPKLELKPVGSRRRMRFLGRLLRFLLALVLFIALGIAALVWIAVPSSSGEVVAGVTSSTEIITDASGVTQIYADNPHDLFFAQGYAHARDRFWQMDFWRHISAGRLSELFGQGQVETDTFLRSMGWHQLAEEDYRGLGPEQKLIADSYAEGVNAYLAERTGPRLSFEYSVLWIQNRTYQPEPWSPIDSLAWGRVMAWDLRSNLEQELERAELSEVLSPSQLEEIYPRYPSETPTIVGGEAPGALLASLPYVGISLSRLDQMLAELPYGLGRHTEGIGSNSWVVSGEHTATGAPILANDPHLGIQMPSIWYQVGLHCRQVDDACPFEVAGVSFAGAPGVVIGHNSRIAWGFTNLGPDTMDLFVERVNPDNPNQYEVDGEWVDMEVTTETLAVAGGDPIEIEIRQTRHGLVVTDLFDLGQLDLDAPESFAVALQWQALQPSTLWTALLGFNTADNWDEFRAAASNFDIAPQNVVYADIDGNIGYQSTGEIPIRAAGDGRSPVPGWTGAYDWSGLVDFDDLPWVLNPPEGFIATANQPVIALRDQPYLGADFDYGFRAQRINQLLEGQSDLDSSDMIRIQLDSYSAIASELVPILVAISGDGDYDLVQSTLATWSQGDYAYQMVASSSGAAAFDVVFKNLLEATFADELGPESDLGTGSRVRALLSILLDQPESPWWDDVSTPATEGLATTLRTALTRAEAEIVERLGSNPARWSWGALHTATFRNATFGESGIAPIEALFNRGGLAVSGDESAVNATGWSLTEPYVVDWIPSMRMVVDLNDLAASTLIHSTGQSGHAFAQHYFDMAREWANGTTRAMNWTRAQVDQGADGVLLLTPAN